jgi:hypothetical protein
MYRVGDPTPLPELVTWVSIFRLAWNRWGWKKIGSAARPTQAPRGFFGRLRQAELFVQRLVE